MKRTALLRWILPVLGICLLLLIAAAATFRTGGDREPLTASAASGDVYYAMPTVCPECGEPPDTNPSAGGSLTFTCIDGRCSYGFVHTGNRGGFTHSGTVTIHTASYVEGRDPTCTSSGYYGYSRCSVCGYFISSMTTIPATGHDYGEWFETIPATCTSQGQEQRACRNKGCSARETRAVAANGHTWDSGTVTLSPTCQRTGTMTYECTSCGGTKTETISKTSHDYSIYRSRIEPTCTSSGRTSGYECRWCSATTCSTLPALGHSYGAYSVTEQPSCTEEGKETAKCSRCSATQTRTVSALGHDEVTDEEMPATCLQTGRSAGSHCSRCGITLKEQTIIPALGHDFRYSVVSEPTCVEEGSSLGTCSRCAETEEKHIPALGHDEVTDEGTPATCLQTGRSAGSHCGRCGITLEEQTIIPALGHDFGEYRETRAPTCTEPGEERAECSRCEAVETRTVAATGHSTGPGATCTEDQVCTVCGAVLSSASGHHPGREATCTEDQVCTVCGAVLNAALGHALKEYEAQAPTCIEEGWEAYSVCIRCGYTTYTELPALGHKAGSAATCIKPQVCTVCGAELAPALGHEIEVLEAVAATCTETGLSEGARCSRCGEVLAEQEQTPALGHLLLMTEDSRESCTDDGILTRRCERCDHTETKEVSGGTHSWKPGAVLKEPTCSEAGIRELVCVFCGETQESEIARMAHELVTAEAVAPTCTAEGISAGVMCSVCGKVLVAQDVLPPAEHRLIHTAGIGATETTDGVREHYTCTVCGGTFADSEGKTELTEEQLRIPAGTQIGPDTPPDTDEETDAAHDGWKTALAVSAAVLLIAAVASLFVFLAKKEKEPGE